MSESIVIVGAKRTPIGAMQGKFNSLAAPQLGAVAVRAALEQAGVGPGEVDDLLMGCVLPAGQGQAPARQAALKAGLPQSVPCTTINKMCGSAMEAAILAHDMLASGSHDVIVAGEEFPIAERRPRGPVHEVADAAQLRPRNRSDIPRGRARPRGELPLRLGRQPPAVGLLIPPHRGSPALSAPGWP